MRADRLVALLLLLQHRGMVTAAEAARELEVSVRTARRDLEALAMSGVPVYPSPGRGGGWRLVGGATTNLTGLNESESIALFAALGQSLGQASANVDAEGLRSAMRKLAGALPEPFRPGAEAASTVLKVDSAGWGDAKPAAPPEVLNGLVAAIIAGHQVSFAYQRPYRPGIEPPPEARRIVSPLGIVNKNRNWYLVANTERGLRNYRIDRASDLQPIDAPPERPPGFDLDREWEAMVATVEDLRVAFRAKVKVSAGARGPVRWVFAGAHEVIEELPDGGAVVQIGAYNEASFVHQIAGFGGRVELLDAPPEVFKGLSAIADELSNLYGQAESR